MFNSAPVYGLALDVKCREYSRAMYSLTMHHYNRCAAYKNVLDGLGYGEALSPDCDLTAYPFLPVRLFKSMDLSSVPEDQITKVIHSSGTTGQGVSKVFLDNQTMRSQTETLSKIVGERLGEKRLPMLIIDCKSTISKSSDLSARAAAIIGFSMFGSRIVFALNEDMTLNYEAVSGFYNRYGNERVVIFGFTYMVWQYFCSSLPSDRSYDFRLGTVIHGGGWKKLTDSKVSDVEFKKTIESKCGISNVYNYYGLVEQAGSIFLECDNGFFHCSNYSEILIRDAEFKNCGFRKRGLVQLMSVLPKSYPGHILLTEDEGEIFGEDDCGCGRLGKYFRIYGRIETAEVRGCSDTYVEV